jgi:hypothetical protein
MFDARSRRLSELDVCFHLLTSGLEAGSRELEAWSWKLAAEKFLNPKPF